MTPIFHTADPRRRARKIRCAVCNVCEWVADPRVNACTYGGPFAESITPAPDGLPAETKE